MPMTVEQIAAEAMNLSTEARAQLVDQLVESLDAGELNRIDRLWSAEGRGPTPAFLDVLIANC